jgi:ElaB/YqjD/DUF883 family membrane-anchored ribosome-binding protein
VEQESSCNLYTKCRLPPKVWPIQLSKVAASLRTLKPVINRLSCSAKEERAEPRSFHRVRVRLYGGKWHEHPGKPGGNNPASPKGSLSSTAGEAVDAVSDAASVAYDTAKSKVDETVKRGKAIASDASVTASDAVEAASQQIRTVSSELEAMAKRNPLGTIIGAVVVGVLIGMMTRPRS